MTNRKMFAILVSLPVLLAFVVGSCIALTLEWDTTRLLGLGGAFSGVVGSSTCWLILGNRRFFDWTRKKE